MSCVVVEELPHASGKHQLSKVYMQFLAHWARELSWKETATTFRTSLGTGLPLRRVFGELGFGAPHPGAIRAIGVDEIQYAKGNK